MKKHILASIFTGFLVFGGGIIPTTQNSQIVYAQNEKTSEYSDFEGIIPSGNVSGVSEKTKELSSRIKRGQVTLGDTVLILVKMIDLVTKLAGTIAVLMLIYGGYQYMIGGISDDKEGAKKRFSTQLWDWL